MNQPAFQFPIYLWRVRRKNIDSCVSVCDCVCVCVFVGVCVSGCVCHRVCQKLSGHLCDIFIFLPSPLDQQPREKRKRWRGEKNFCLRKIFPSPTFFQKLGDIRNFVETFCTHTHTDADTCDKSLAREC